MGMLLSVFEAKNYPKAGLPRHFGQVVGNGQKTCFNGYFFATPEHKATSALVVFEVSENRFDVCGTLLSFLNTQL